VVKLSYRFRGRQFDSLTGFRESTAMEQLSLVQTAAASGNKNEARQMNIGTSLSIRSTSRLEVSLGLSRKTTKLKTWEKQKDAVPGKNGLRRRVIKMQ
jgi:hypothetical protein